MKASSVAWSAAGLGVPLLVALLALPPLLVALGAERFGLLSLAWALCAMAGLFDLGIGRATTRQVAEQLGRGERDKLRPTLEAAIKLSLLAGGAGGLVLAAGVAAGLHRGLNFDPALEAEVRGAGFLLALAIPLQTAIATYRGVSEACQQFRGISLVRMALGVANFAAPWAVSLWTRDLTGLVAALLLSRVLACLAFRGLALRAAPPAREAAGRLTAQERRSLLRSGSWYTVSAVLSPVLVQADRFVIGALVSAAAVTAYTLPFDVITQLLVAVSAVTTVAFPSIASQLQADRAAAAASFRRWLRRVALGMALLAGGVALVLPQALAWWIGPALPPESVAVGRWLCLGVWINALGAMYFAWLHAHGRFRATALLHLAELPLYLGLLAVLVRQVGVTGAAIAWVARVALDTAALAWIGRQAGARGAR